MNLPVFLSRMMAIAPVSLTAAFTQVMIELVKAAHAGTDFVEHIQDLRSVLFFLDLLGDEPLQKYLAGYVFFGKRQGVNGINQPGHLLLVCVRLLKDILG